MPIWQGPDPLDVAPEVIFDLLLLPLLLEISSRFRFFSLLRELPAEQLVGPAFDFWQNSTWSEKFGEVEWVQGERGANSFWGSVDLSKWEHTELGTFCLPGKKSSGNLKATLPL